GQRPSLLSSGPPFAAAAPPTREGDLARVLARLAHRPRPRQLLPLVRPTRWRLGGGHGSSFRSRPARISLHLATCPQGFFARTPSSAVPQVGDQVRTAIAGHTRRHIHAERSLPGGGPAAQSRLMHAEELGDLG